MSIQNSKFFKLFSQLPSKERESFINYTQNKSFCNSSKISDFVNLFSIEPFQTNKKTIFKVLYPNKQYRDIDLRMILSKTYQLLTKFVAIQEVQNENQNTFEWQMKAALNLNYLDFAKDILKNWKKTIVSLPKFSDSCFQSQMKYAEYEYYVQSKQIGAAKRVAALNFDSLNQATDHYFILKKLKHFIGQLNYQSMVKSDIQLSFLAEIETYINSKLELPAAIPIYYAVMQLYQQFDNEANFYTLRELLQENIQHFENEEGRELYLHLQNFCIRKVNKGDQSFLQTLYDIYFEMVANETIYENNTLSQWTYKNVVSAGLRLKDYKGVSKFITDQNKKLEPKFQETAFAFNQANLLFSTQKYQESIFLLQSINTGDVFYLLGSKVLLAKAYYELDETDALQSLMESFKKLLTRKKLLTPRHILTHSNFLKVLKKLMSCTKQKAPDLKLKLQQLASVAERNWLLEKVGEIGL